MDDRRVSAATLHSPAAKALSQTEVSDTLSGRGKRAPFRGVREKGCNRMAEKTAKGKGAAAGPKVPKETLDRVAAEIAARRRPMTLAELLEITEQ
jgi:hypothetical protein